MGIENNYFKQYILDENNEPVEEPDTRKWGMWFEKKRKHVRLTHIGTVTVSTIFLGLDHNWEGKGKPVLFESMIFNGPYHDFQIRYRTYKEAVEGHEALVKKCQRINPVLHLIYFFKDNYRNAKRKIDLANWRNKKKKEQGNDGT